MEHRACHFATSGMRRVVYISRSLPETDGEIDAIVQASRSRNESAGIIGILWVGDGEFVQALEGRVEAIDETLKRIVDDPRHTDLEIACDTIVQSRMFGSWAMVRSDPRPECIVGAAYLIGLAGRQPFPAARRVVEFLLSHEEP